MHHPDDPEDEGGTGRSQRSGQPVNDTLLDELTAHDVPLLTGACGVAIIVRARTRLIGLTPSIERVQSIVRGLESSAERGHARASDALPGELESPASGTLAFAIDSEAGEYLLWFSEQRTPTASDACDAPETRDAPSPWSAADRTLAANVTYSVLLKTKRQLAKLVGSLHEERRARSRALVGIGHELRNSLGILGGWTGILRAGPPGKEQGSRAIDVIDRNIRLQRRLVDDLVETSKQGAISGITLDAHDVDLLRLVRDMLDACRPALDAKQLRLEVELERDLGVVRGDADRLGQVLANVLANAVKFTPAGGLVRVGALRSERHVEVRISDTGIGISPGFLPNVFDAFRQADPKSNPSGLGVGLTIAKQLIELHGGQIIAESAGIGSGATFRILLPAMRALAPGTSGS